MASAGTASSCRTAHEVGVRSALMILLLGGAAALSGPARAEDQGGGAVATDVEAVTVTARKKEEKLLDVPVAATVLSKESIERYNVTDLTQLAVQTPGLIINTSPGGTSGSIVSIRGVEVLGPDYGSEQPIEVVVDGVPITRGHIISSGFFDDADIQVLKGPQSLYYGKDSPAGVIVIDSVTPGSTRQGYLRASYGINEEDPIIEGAATIPVTDHLSIRFGARVEDMFGGYVKAQARQLAVDPNPDPVFNGAPTPLPGALSSVYPQTKQILGRFTVAWTPSSNFDATLKMFASYNNQNSYAGDVTFVRCQSDHPQYTNLLTGQNYPDLNASCAYSRTNNDAGMPGPIASTYRYGSGNKYYNTEINYINSLTMNYRFDHMTLTSITGIYKMISPQMDNNDYTVFGETPDYSKESTFNISQELRLASNFAGPLNFTAGAFFEHQDSNFLNTNRIFLLGLYPVPGPYYGISNTVIVTDQNRDTDYSVFGELDWKILPNLELTGGARWTHSDKTDVQATPFNAFDAFLPAAFNPLSPGGAIYNLYNHNDNVSPEATLSWHPRRDVMLYADYKTGFLAGGIANPGVVSNYSPAYLAANHLPANTAEQQLVYQPETSRGFEVGAKASLLDGRLSGDFALYRYTYDNLQVSTFHPATTTFTIGNAASSLDEGVELSANYAVTDALAIHTAIEYAYLKFLRYPIAPCYVAESATLCPNGSQNLNGRRFGPAPLTINLGGAYHRPLTPNLNLGLNADVTSFSISPDSIQTSLQPGTATGAHVLLNAALRIYPTDGKWEFAVLGTNLTDALYSDEVYDKPLGPPGDILGSVNPGREVRLQITWRY